MKQRTFHHQQGIALGPILFIIAILAILAAAIAAGSGGFTASTNTESAKVMAQAIIDYGDQIQAAVNVVLSNECTNTQVSFENPMVSGYTNPNAPADHSCHVLDPRGGGAIWKKEPANTNSTGSDRCFSSIYQLQGVGTQNFLVMYQPVNSLAVCNEINAILGNPTSLALHSITTTCTPYIFTGSYSPNDGAFPRDGGNIAGFTGKTAGCVGGDGPGYWPQNTGNNYLYYQALLIQ